MRRGVGAFAVEGTGQFGAGLSRFLADYGEQVFEVGRLRRERHSGGKTDPLDAVRGRRSVFEQKRPATPRSSEEREALRALMAARRSCEREAGSLVPVFLCIGGWLGVVGDAVSEVDA